MVPITKDQKEVYGLYLKSAHITSLPFAKWVRERVPHTDCIDALIYSRKSGDRWCPYCGGAFTPAKNKPNSVEKCPHCGAKVHIPETRYQYHFDGTRTERREDKITSFRVPMYVEKLEVCKGWQVDRIFLADYECKKGKPITLVTLVEVFSNWINPATASEVRLGRNLTMCPSYTRIPFSIYDDCALMSVKKINRSSYKSNWYSGWNTALYPHRGVLPFYNRVNYSELKTKKCDWFDVFDCVRDNTSAVIVETLAKIGDKALLTEYMNSSDNRTKIRKYWRSIVIAKRHGLKWGRIASRDYIDYLTQLDKLHLDMHSPHYLVPDDFIKAHNDLTQRLMSAEEKRRRRIIAERDYKKMTEEMKKNDAYVKRCGKFFGVCITDGFLKASPLQSIKEFYEEGTAMHHCVFTNSYYNHPHCLILSVKDEFGNRVETVEVDTSAWRIVQSRGVSNSQTAFHDDIINMFTKNMSKLKACCHKRTNNYQLQTA